MERKRSSEHIRYRYGICLNDNCQKCKSKEVLQIPARKDFVCAECGKPLRECPPPKNGNNKLYIIISAVALVAVIVFCIFFFMDNKKSSNPDDFTSIDSLEVDSMENKADSVFTVDKQNLKEKDSVILETTPLTADKQKTKNVAIEEKNTTEYSSNRTKQPDEIVSTSSAGQTTKRLSCGIYNGPMSNGVPNGIGGIITVTNSHAISLKDGTGESVIVNSGDKIVDTKFKNGVLQQGQIIRSNGERKYISGLAERL